MSQISQMLKPLLIGLLPLISGPALAIPEVTAQAEATVLKRPPAPPKSLSNSKKVVVNRKGKAPVVLPNLLATPTPNHAPQASVTVPISPVVPKSDHPAAAPKDVTQSYYMQQRPYIGVSALGLLIGDYQLQPRVYFSTDNRLDDSNTRERAMRDDLDWMESRKRGEIHEDTITRWLRTRGQGGMPGTDPGYQVAYAIQRVLQGSIRLPNFLNYSPAPNTYRPTPPVLHNNR